MSDAVEDMFGDLANERYPGSRFSRRKPAPPRVKDAEAWDANPVIKTVRGERWELFTVGHLGKALGGRAPVTIRLWEREGILPKARIRLANKNGKGGRRYYRREEVEVAVALAHKHGMYAVGSTIDKAFGPAVLAAWQALGQQR